MALKQDISAQLGILGGVDTSSLTFRVTSISIPRGKMDSDSEDYFNVNNIIAVNGYLEGKRHFCYLIGDIPGGNVPDPNKHIVYEWHWNTLDETDIKDDVILPSSVPPTTHGFAMLQVEQNDPPPTPATPSLASGKYPEQNPEDGTFIGTADGGMSIDNDGNVEIVSGGKSVAMPDADGNVDLGDSKLKSTNDGFTNWLLMKNPFRDGSLMGVPMPNVLPLFPLAYDPFPNIPGIIEMYLRIQVYKGLVEGIKELGEEIKELQEEF